MTPVTSLTELDQAVAIVRLQADNYVTNLYCDRPTLEKWYGQQALSLITTEKSMFLIRRLDHFAQLYFAAANKDALSDSIAQVRDLISRPAIVDLIGPEAAIKSIRDCFSLHGFGLREQLIRLSAVPPLKRSSLESDSVTSGTNLNVVAARLSDIDWILQGLSKDFDPLVDQFPSHEDLQHLITSQQILICLIKNQPVGFVLAYRNGSTTLIKYWYVSLTFRGQGVGSALMDALTETEPRPKRLLLWVKNRNQVAIERYEHYGFRREGLLDEVYCLEDARP